MRPVSPDCTSSPSSNRSTTGTKLLLNVRLDQLASVSRQADKVLRVIAVNFAVPATAPATATLLDGSSSSSGGAALLADTSPSIGASSDRASTPAATPAVSTMPALQSFLLKTKNAAVRLSILGTTVCCNSVCTQPQLHSPSVDTGVRRPRGYSQ